MSESTDIKKSGLPLKLIVDIQSNKVEKTDMEISGCSKKIEYTPGILKFINALVEDMVRQDLAK